MPLEKLSVTGLDDKNQRRRLPETINKILDHQFDDSRRRTDAEVSAGVTPVNYAYPPGDVRRYGSNTDPGVTDMTLPIAAALSVGSTHPIVFQPETYLTGKQTIVSGSYIDMPPGCMLLDTGVLGVNDRFLNISSEDELAPVQNVHIVGYGATVKLIKANYGTGEQRAAVFIAGSVDNITIEGLACIDAGGDGFYIGGVGGGLQNTPDNVRLYACIGDNNRRNAVSITAGRSIIIDHCILANSNGNSPQKGIDIEPDQSGGEMVGDLYDILVTGCRAYGNLGAGFSYVNPYTLGGKVVTITFRDCVDIGSNSNFSIEEGKNGGENATITFDNCSGFSALTNGFDHFASSTHCLITGMRIFNPNQSGQSDNRYGSAYSFYTVNRTDGTTYGNVTMRNCFAFGTSGNKTVVQQIIGEAASVFANMDIEVFTDAAVNQRAFYDLTASQIVGKNRVTFVDETEIPVTGSLGTSAMTLVLNDLITNEGASGALALVLDDPLTRLPGVRVKARVKATHEMQLSAEAGWTIGGGSVLRSKTPGSEVTVESDGVSKWRIVEGGEGWAPYPIVLDNTGTPSVANGTSFETGGTTTITAFDDGAIGQKITVLVKHAVTFDTTGTTLKAAGGDISAASGDWLEAVYDVSGNWRIAFHDCT